MTHKLVGAIQVGPHRYGLYEGDQGVAWYGPPGTVLEILHQIHVRYDTPGLGRQDQADYQPSNWHDRLAFCAEVLGGQVILEPKGRPPAPEMEDREYQQAAQPVPKLRPKTPAERGLVDPDSLTAALMWNRLVPADPIDQPQQVQPAEKGGKGSGNWGHQGRPGKRGGSAPKGTTGAGRRSKEGQTQVGITSHRAGRTPGQAKAAGEEWRQDLEATTARNVNVQFGIGGYEGGREPTYVTTYEGNGEALKAAARFGKKYEQDAVIVQKFVGQDAPGAEPIDELSFNRALTTQQIRAAETVMGAEGIGGWTWSRGTNGNTRLQMTFIPDWADYNRDTHSFKVDRVRRYMNGAGTSVTRFTDWVKTTIMYGDTYDAYASGELKALVPKV